MSASLPCGAVTASGSPCRRRVASAGEFCSQHQGEAEPVGLVEAAGSGDRRVTLEALRDRLAVELERVADDGFCVECKRGSSSVAPLAKQLTDVLSQLETLPSDERETPLDELRRRRAERQARAAG